MIEISLKSLIISALFLQSAIALPLGTIDQQFPEDLDDQHFTEDRYLLKIEYGKITQTDFNELKRAFRFPNSVIYDPNRVYTLYDFLSPPMQALVNRTFTLEHRPFDLTSAAAHSPLLNDTLRGFLMDGLNSYSNCWNTVWEITRMAHSATKSKEYHLYWPSRTEALNQLTDARYSREVPLAEIQSGDVALFLEDNTQNGGFLDLNHTGIYLGGDYFFEKTNASSSDPYRVAYFSDVQKKLQDAFGSQLRTRVRRFNESGFLPLPNPTSITDSSTRSQIAAALGLNVAFLGPIHLAIDPAPMGGSRGSLTEIKTVEIEIDPATGQGTLEGSEPLLKRFKDISYSY